MNTFAFSMIRLAQSPEAFIVLTLKSVRRVRFSFDVSAFSFDDSLRFPLSPSCVETFNSPMQRMSRGCHLASPRSRADQH
ncbi:hypothetical protein NTD87_25270 [Pseudomonas sp. 6D_7.1_Bac1]|nr:hypothetical protein [Pseudomonas sp. 6D_7.1_Bac1]